MSKRRQDEANVSGRTTGAFGVDDWLVEPASGRISRNGEQIQLEPKAMDVLVYLSQRPDEVVSREQLETAIWADRVVGYDAVTNAIIKLRKAFHDNARKPRIIETLSKRGYRLVARVEPATTANGSKSGLVAPTRWGRNRSKLIYAGALMGLFAVALVLWSRPGVENRPKTNSASAPPAETLSIVVLPFANLTADATQDYFSNGITEDLITALSKFPGLAVIARGSAFAYRGDDSVEQLRRELGVQYVLRGSVRREGTQVRINTQLIDTLSGRHLWAERYDATLKDTFAVQDAITGQIAAVLRVHLAADSPGVVQNYAASVEAYDYLLQGLDHFGRRALDEVEEAKTYYEQAIALDPKFARAYANLGLVYLRLATDGWGDYPQTSLQQAQTLAEQALALDDNLAEVHFVNAYVALFRRDHETAIHDLDRALALRPSYADAYALLAWVLNFAGRPDHGQSVLAKAIRLNPRVPTPYYVVQADMAFALGRYAEAIATLEKALEINPTSPRLYLLLAGAYAQAGQREDAYWITEQLVALHPNLSLGKLDNSFPFKDQTQEKLMLDSLRLAGLPE